MGMNQIYMLGGGEGGAQHFIKQFGPTLEWPWSHLKAPKLNQEIAVFPFIRFPFNKLKFSSNNIFGFQLNNSVTSLLLNANP